MYVVYTHAEREERVNAVFIINRHLRKGVEIRSDKAVPCVYESAIEALLPRFRTEKQSNTRKKQFKY